MYGSLRTVRGGGEYNFVVSWKHLLSHSSIYLKDKKMDIPKTEKEVHDDVEFVLIGAG